MKHTEVVRVVYHMATPILLNHPWIHFDGLLAHIVARMKHGQDYYLLDSRRPIEEVVTLDEIPVTKICRSSVCFADASVSMIDGRLPPYDRLYPAHVRKRFTERHIHTVATHRRRVEIAKGPFKLFDLEYAYAPARTVEFLAKGYEDEIAELARKVVALGAKRAEGWGFVRRVEVVKTELKHAYTLPDGTVTRPVPIDPFIDVGETMRRYGHLDSMLHTYRPPYWDRRHATLCTIPGRRYVVRMP